MSVCSHMLFILNRIAGGRSSESYRKSIESIVSRIPGSSLALTDYAGHAREIASAAVKDGCDLVVAVGGDGTVNEIASVLVGTDVALGIVPIGSGNGLARHLGIPLDLEGAVKAILERHVVTIDYATINGKPFFCTTGIGFDALVANDYAKAGTRGLITYVKEAINDWFSYAPGEYVIETDNRTIRTKALLITVGNANQWGNDYFITPHASLKDGKLDIAIVKPANILSYLKMVWQLRHKTLAENPDVVYLKSPFVKITCLSESNVAAHYDGEATSFNGNIVIDCKKESLRVVSS